MFSILGKLLKIVLVIGISGLIIAFGINEAADRGWLKPNPLTKLGLSQVTWQNGWWQITHLSQYWSGKPGENGQNNQLSQIWQQAGPQLTTLKDRGLATAGVAQTFVKTQVITAEPTGQAGNSSSSATGQSGPSPTLAPLEQRALDYARYVYCQAAVKDYEQQHPEVTKK
jgi:hypothetical protein